MIETRSRALLRGVPEPGPPGPAARRPGQRPGVRRRAGARTATTIVALTYADGVVMAGDRRATMGNVIASRHIEKVFETDRYSVMGIAGAAGVAIDIAKLFHGGTGALREDRGHAAVPGRQGQPAGLHGPRQPADGHAGHERRPALCRLRHASGTGRIFSFDITGGRYEEVEHHSVGSGSAVSPAAP